MVGHHACDCIAAPVERERLADDGGVGSELAPERCGNHDAGLVLEPSAQNRINTELAYQRRRDRNTFYVMRFAREGQVLAREAEPSKRVEDARPRLVRLRVFQGQRPVVLGIVDCCTEDGDEPVAVAIRQRLQHHRVDDGVYRRSRSDACCKRRHGEECDSLVVPPGSPRLQDEHAGIMQRGMARA